MRYSKALKKCNKFCLVCNESVCPMCGVTLIGAWVRSFRRKFGRTYKY